MIKPARSEEDEIALWQPRVAVWRAGMRARALGYRQVAPPLVEDSEMV